MGNSKWSLFHDIGYVYFVLGVMAQSEEKTIQVRLSKMKEKFSEWPTEGNNNEKILKEVMQTAGRDMEDSMDPVLKKLQSSISNIVENLSKDNLKAIINDLLSIVNAASPSDVEIDQINSMAEQIGVKPLTKQKAKGKSEQSSTDDESWTLLHDMCYLYYIVASLPIFLGSKDAKNVKLRIDAGKEKILEWPSDDVDGEQLVKKVSRVVTKAWSSDGIIVGDKIKELAAKIKEYMPEENHQLVIEDLQYIVNKWSPNKDDDKTMIEGIAHIILDDGGSADEGEKKAAGEQTDNANQVKESLNSEFLSLHTEPSYPGQFYFLTEKYSSKPINIKNFLRLSRIDELFRKFTKHEVDCLVKKIKTTRTIPKLSFIRDILEEKYEIPVKDAPFWFIPFVILAEKIGCFLYFDRNGIYANHDKAREINPCFSWEGATDVTCENGFPESEDGDDGDLEISISPDPEAEYADPGETVSTLILETDDGHLTINEFHGDQSGSQLLIIKTIWDLWKIVVDYSRGSSIWPQDDKVPNGPEYMYFDSWDGLLAWVESGSAEDKTKISSSNVVAAIKTDKIDGDDANNVTDKNEDLYRQKVKDALADGVVTDLERTGLDFFQNKLKIPDEDALRIFEEVLTEMQEKHEEKRIKTRTDDTKEAAVEESMSEETDEEADGGGKSSKKRITYATWSEFEKEQGVKDERRKVNLPIASKIHDLIIIALRENNRKFEIRYGDGTFSFSMPKEEAKSGKRTFARVGLLSLADKIVYLDTLYKGANDTIPTGGIPWRKNDNTQYVFRLKTIEDFEKVKNSIREGVMRSYNCLAISKL